MADLGSRRRRDDGRGLRAAPLEVIADATSRRRDYDSRMTASDPRSDRASFTQALIADHRAHGGRITFGPFEGRPVLLLHTLGAKTGEPRIAPLVYSRDGARFVIMASKGGAPANPAWFANLVAHPEVTVEAEGETFRAQAIVAQGTERDRLWSAHVAQHPGFADYEQRTARVIPAIWLERIAS